MTAPKIKTGQRIIPMIYAYTTPNDISHTGWTKIGYTDKQSVDNRIKEQTHTADVKYDLLWKGNARYNDGSDKVFNDYDFHNYLTTKRHIERKPGTEWFHIGADQSHQYFYKFTERDFRDLQWKDKQQGTQYELRREQKQAVQQTMAYFHKHGAGSEFLWNAKPRFGKTLTTYDLARQMKFRNVLVVTNRPSIANSWYDDFAKFIGWQTNFYFVSETDSLANRPTLSREEYVSTLTKTGEDAGQIAFESLQGIKGSIYMGGDHDKLEWVVNTDWDLLVIDEAHEGVDTYKTSKAFDHINRNYTLHLTGTPFKALANGKFAADQIFNWSYADEQEAKANWDEDKEGSSNPYDKLPRLNMYTYQMSAIMEEKAKKGINLEEGQVNPAFDLNEFFKTDKKGAFVHDELVDNFLNALTKQEKYPFSTPELRNELKHSFWLLNRVTSAKELKRKLEKHPIFGEYKIVLAAGNGKMDANDLDDYEMNDDQLNKASSKAFDRVQTAIKKYDKTITLSVGQLTTGVTVKPWTAVLMLSSMKSASEYMQAAFRAQNPYIYHDEQGHVFQKDNAYVFDFDPTRTLTIFDKFANNLAPEMAKGSGTTQERKDNIKRLLNFFPVIGEDEAGRMVELDPTQVLSIPRRLKSREVVDQKFMSNFLFQNITSVFSAPQVVKDILNDLEIAKESKGAGRTASVDDASADLVDEEGNAKIDHDRVVGKSREIFGDKIYDVPDLPSEFDGTDTDQYVKKATELVKQHTKTIVNEVQSHYQLSQQEAHRIQKQQVKVVTKELQQHVDHFNDEKKSLKHLYQKQLQTVTTEAEMQATKADFSKQLQQLNEQFSKDNQATFERESSPVAVMERIERHNAEVEKHDIEEDVRAHLRGFSRTIPSFIMAYGDANLTLQNFDDYTEDAVFQEVTGISEDQFRFLRDGGDYPDAETGEQKHFAGHLFDEVVFNDSIQEFLKKKAALSNYFAEDSTKDIFDYIPAQKTNQIYTPRAVVKHMVDDLEANNPGIFDDPDKTFADLYMKSGLYITEIIKRLFRSTKMKSLFPDDHERIKHIVEHQVYGFAPTRIIFLIATNYIFGFDDDLKATLLNSHFKQVDAAEAAKAGKLQQVVQAEFGDQ